MPLELFTNAANPTTARATTLGAAMLAGDLTLSVASSTGFPAAVAGVSQFRVLIESEIVIVTNVALTTWTVTRGAEGTAAVGHALGVAVNATVTAGALGNADGIPDPLGAGVPFTFHPALATTTGTLQAGGNIHIHRSNGGGTITKIALWVGVSAGNIDVAVVRGTGGVSTPTIRVASSGSVPCPAAGYAEVSLTAGAVVSAATDYLALGGDSATSTFFTVNAGSGLNAALASSFGYRQTATFPIAATLAPVPFLDRNFILVGRP